MFSYLSVQLRGGIIHGRLGSPILISNQDNAPTSMLIGQSDPDSPFVEVASGKSGLCQVHRAN